MTETDPDLLARHRADLTDALFSAVRRLRWPPERLAAEREHKLRELLAWSAARSPFHAARLAGIDVDTFTESDLPSIPIMTKVDLMANFDRVVTDPELNLEVVNEHVERLDDHRYLLDKYHVVATSGTTGVRGLFVYGWDEWRDFVVMATRWQGRDGSVVPPDAPIASLFASNATHLSGALHAFLRDRSDGGLPRMMHLPPASSLPDIVTALNASPPVVLQGYPSSVYLLALEAKAGRLDIRPQRIVTCGEQCTDEIRAAAADAWGVDIYDYWGCSEGAYAFPCASAAGMHLPDDFVIIEPIDDEGNAVGDGELASRILLTSLYNRTQPLIRYELNDAMAITPKVCPCGCAHRRITRLDGRSDAFFFAYDGDVIVQTVGVEELLLSDPHVVTMQVSQTVRGARVRVITDGSCDLERLRRGLVALMLESGLADPEVTILEIDSPERLWSGKVRAFEPL